MKIVLLENIRKIGSIGDVIDVKRGYARNFLISQKKALFASKENIKQVENIKIDLNKKDQERKKDAKNIKEKIQNKSYTVSKLCTENKELYGSVKPTEISKIMKEIDDLDVNPSLIQPVNDIKSLGKFKVNLNLHSEVLSQIYVEVVSKEEIK